MVKEAGVMCFVAFQRRFDANFMRLKAAVTNGEVGDIHMMHIVSRDPSPPPVAYIKVGICTPIVCNFCTVCALPRNLC